MKAFLKKAVEALPDSLNESLHTCAFKIKVCFFPAWISALKICFTASFVNQRVRWKDAKSLQKSVSWIWWECGKALPLHPQSREMRQWLKYWKQRWGFEPYRFKKTFWKFFPKSFGSSKKSPYLCIRFRKDSYKEEFFERFRYEQASSTILTKVRKQKPSINFNW